MISCDAEIDNKIHIKMGSNMNYQQHNFAVKAFKLLSNANRLKIINLLIQNKDGLVVNDISLNLKIASNNVSNHLLRLRENGILRAKQNGNFMSYSIRDNRFAEILELAKKLATIY